MKAVLILCVIILLLTSCSAEDCICGIENASPRIINGHVANPGQFPWVVYILNRDLMMSCTGSIISDRHIVTAAHCLSPRHQDPASLFVFTAQGCGKSNLFAGKQIRVRKAFRHAAYSTRTGGNDIGLLQLDRPLVFNSTFMPICLTTDKQPADNLVTLGWGNSNSGFHIVDNDCLNEADLNVVPDHVCRLHYGPYLDTEKIMCAGGEQNICNGDSGGPLMTRRNGLVYLMGITSFGRNDCGLVTKQPAGFERLSSHIEWLISRSLLSRPCFGDKSGLDKP